MNIGVVVEGPSDAGAYRELLQRIRNDVSSIQVRVCGGKSKMKAGFLGFLKEFDRNPAWHIDAAIVVRDSDCGDPGQIEQQMRDVYSTSGFRAKFSVEFFAVQCVLESWLLSDLQAIRLIPGSRNLLLPHSIQVLSSHSAQDKGTFTRVLSHFGLSVTPEVYAAVARGVNLSMIENRCSYFRHFRARISSL